MEQIHVRVIAFVHKIHLTNQINRAGNILLNSLAWNHKHCLGQRGKNHTLSRGTYKGVPPPPGIKEQSLQVEMLIM